jgi:hypothetical protein
MKRNEILRALGYTLSVEDGAEWEHKDFIWEDRFVWRGTPLSEILREHNEKVETASICCAVARVDKVQIFAS